MNTIVGDAVGSVGKSNHGAVGEQRSAAVEGESIPVERQQVVT